MARNPIRADPTRTGLIREAFERDMRHRWVALAAAVKQLVEVENVFGIQPKPPTQNQTRQRWTTGVGTRLVVHYDPSEARDEKGEWTTSSFSTERMDVKQERTEGRIMYTGKLKSEFRRWTEVAMDPEHKNPDVLLTVDTNAKDKSVYLNRIDALTKRMGLGKELLTTALTRLQGEGVWETARAYVEHLNDAPRKMNRELGFTLEKTAEQGDYFSKKLTTNADSAWAWTTNNDKLKLFSQWLDGQIQAKILTIPKGSTPWTAQYITSAYRKGLVRAYTQMHSEALAEDSDVYKGTQAQFLDAAFAAPVAADKVKLLATRSFESLKGVSSTAAQQMNQILAQGLIDGSSPGDIANDMTDRISSLTDTRAMLIARTEVIYAHAEGQLDSFKRLGVDKVGVEVEFLTSGDDRVCPECMAMEGLVVAVDDAHGIIPLHPNCVLGSTIIHTARPLSLMRTKYFGKIIEIVTAKGGRLSVTENHVLLTQRGWVRAKELTQSDYLFDATRFNGSAAGVGGRGGPNDNQHPPCIRDIFAATVPIAAKRAQRGAYPVTAKDFHGDGQATNGEVDIIHLDRLLWDDLQPELIRQLVESKFMVGDVVVGAALSLRGQSPFALFLIRYAAAADCFMGFKSAQSVLFRGFVASDDTVLLELGAQRDVHLDESFPQCVSGKSELLLKTVQRDSSLVEFDEVLKSLWCNVDAKAPFQSLRASSNESSFIQTCSKILSANGQRTSDGFAAESLGGVEMDRVSSVRVVDAYSGHGVDVYDVETKETAYLANGFVSSNCRCAWLPANVGEDDTGQGGAFSDTGDDTNPDDSTDASAEDEDEDASTTADDLNAETADAEA